MNGLQSLDMWKASFHNPGPSELGLLNAIQNVGQLLSLPFCAGYCDRFGRRKALIASATIILAAVGLQGGAQNTPMFILARGLLGFGLALNITAAPLLIIELAYPSHAAPLVSIYNSLWGLGALSAAWITYGSFRISNDWAWRIPSLLQGTSSAIQIGLCSLIEESPRWLVSVDRTEEARALLIKYHANGDANDPVVASELEEIRAALRVEASSQKTTSQWSGNGLVSYYLTLILDSIGYKTQDTQTFINAMLTIWGLVVGIAFSLVVNRFKRRTLFLTSTAGCLVSYGIWTGLEAVYENSLDADGNGGDEVAARGVLAVIVLFGFFYAIGWGTLQVTYPLEILPFGLRARGLVLYNLFCALALIFNQYVNPIGIADAGWKFYIVYDVWILVELIVVYFFFVETGGTANLEQVAKILGAEDEGGAESKDGSVAEKATTIENVMDKKHA
ncbi:hypothetical protein NUW58_g1942 [Xylaria curta]|uniref:Uncharacterized protein n=1 Tax=Xylaria curta TaxID=42375 RepID=A0ACC1PIH2_9PEZI|nr:hypothetical protein NUW58_g1942 [Xylaria curta]